MWHLLCATLVRRVPPDAKTALISFKRMASPSAAAEEALLDQVEEGTPDHRRLLSTRQQQYLDLLRDPAFHYQHLTREVRRPVLDNTQSGWLEPVHNIWPPDAFSEPCASNPKPTTRLTMAFGRASRFPFSSAFDDRPGPGNYEGPRVVPGRLQPGGEQLVGNSSHPHLVPRRAVRWTAENNVATGPGKYDLPLPMLSGTPASDLTLTLTTALALSIPSPNPVPNPGPSPSPNPNQVHRPRDPRASPRASEPFRTSSRRLRTPCTIRPRCPLGVG